MKYKKNKSANKIAARNVSLIIFLTSFLFLPFQNCKPVGDGSTELDSILADGSGGSSTNPDAIDPNTQDPNAQDPGPSPDPEVIVPDAPPAPDPEAPAPEPQPVTNENAPTFSVSDVGDQLFLSGFQNDADMGQVNVNLSVTFDDLDDSGQASSAQKTCRVRNGDANFGSLTCQVVGGQLRIRDGNANCVGGPNRGDQITGLTVQVRLQEANASGIDFYAYADGSENTNAPYDTGFVDVPGVTITVENNCLNQSGAKVTLNELTGGYFGDKVAIYSNYAVATSRETSQDEAQVHIFENSGSEFVKVQSFTVSELSGLPAGSFIGAGQSSNKEDFTSISIFEDTFVVGNKNLANCMGKAFIVQRNSGSGVWELKNTLNPVEALPAGANCVTPYGDMSNGATWKHNVSYFGQSVSIWGDRVAVGAHFELGKSDYSANNGTAYIFDIDNATKATTATRRIISDSPNVDFGHAISLRGTDLVIGAPENENGSSSVGSAYLFNNVDMLAVDLNILASTKNQKFDNIPADNGSRFGSAVDVEGTVTVIGASGDNKVTVFDGVTRYEITEGATSFGNQVAMVNGRLFASESGSNEAHYYKDFTNPNTGYRLIQPRNTVNGDALKYSHSLAIDRSGASLEPFGLLGAPESGNQTGQILFVQLPHRDND